MVRTSIGIRLRDVLCFTVGLAAVGFLLGRVLPRGEGDLLADKLAHLARHRDAYDTLFLGSSVVYRGYDPLAFDAATRAAGLETRSYNLGVLGFHVVDMVQVAEQLEGLELEGLRWVIVHAGELIGEIDIDFPLTNKAVAWHDIPATLLAFERLFEADLPRKKRWLNIYRHSLACAYRYLNVGRGTGTLSGLLGRESDPAARVMALGPGQLGYQAPEADRSENNLRQREEFQRVINQYLRRVARYRPPPDDGSTLGPRAVQAIERLDRAIRALGAQPIYVTGVHLPSRPGLPDACASGIVGPTLRYDDPRLHPELYRPNHRFDRAHLNREGGRTFSELLARDFAQLVRDLDARTGSAR